MNVNFPFFMYAIFVAETRLYLFFLSIKDIFFLLFLFRDLDDNSRRELTKYFFVTSLTSFGLNNNLIIIMNLLAEEISLSREIFSVWDPGSFIAVLSNIKRYFGMLWRSSSHRRREDILNYNWVWEVRAKIRFNRNFNSSYKSRNFIRNLCKSCIISDKSSPYTKRLLFRFEWEMTQRHNKLKFREFRISKKKTFPPHRCFAIVSFFKVEMWVETVWGNFSRIFFITSEMGNRGN